MVGVGMNILFRGVVGQTPALPGGDFLQWSEGGIGVGSDEVGGSVLHALGFGTRQDVAVGEPDAISIVELGWMVDALAIEPGAVA